MKNIHFNSRHTASFAVVMAMTMSLLFCGAANSEEQATGGDAAPQATASATPGNAAATSDDDWHTDFTFYLWFPGTHGTTGVNGHDVNFRASAGDILSHFRFGLMGTLGVQRGRFVGIGDLIWVRLAAYNSRTLPFPGLPQLSSTVKAQQFILTPEIGYRVVDHEKIKIDALMGLRYWHLGSSLQFTPSLGLNLSPSANWVDPLTGRALFFRSRRNWRQQFWEMLVAGEPARNWTIRLWAPSDTT